MGLVLTSGPSPRPPRVTDGSGAAGGVLVARGISKTFAGRGVLHSLDLSIAAGEVRGLLGHNGSGKSTFVKILAGYHRPEPGASLAVCGRPVAWSRSGPDPARRSMSFVHQDLALVPTATVLENFGTGRYLTGPGGSISWRRERVRLAAALERFEVALPADRMVGELSGTDQALLAVARAVDRMAGRHAGVLVLDEPTGFLPRDGTDRVLEAIRALAGQGIGVLLVTHNLAEVRAVTDVVTVLRDGCSVLEAATADLTHRRLIEAMAPEGQSSMPRAPRPAPVARDVVLAVRDLCAGDVQEVSFEVRAGQIVGLTGLVASGFAQVPYALFGSSRSRRGSLWVRGQRLDPTRLTPRHAINAGVCLVPGDRARQAAVPALSMLDNLTLGNLGRHLRNGRLRQDSMLGHTARLLREFGVRPAQPQQQFGTFSGGNQQKAVLAKWLDRAPAVLLLDEPVRGVDMASRARIFTRLTAVAATGTAVVIASADYDALTAVCDTVLVFTGGRIGDRLCGEEITPPAILAACYRHTKAAAGDAAMETG